MPLRALPDRDVSYHLISFDKHGVERGDDADAPQGLMSQLVLDTLETRPVTDIFIFSHGWLNDLPRAVQSYDHWITAMADSKAHLEAVQQRRSGYRPLLIGLHWPSLPFGSHDPSKPVSFGAPGNATPLSQLLEDAAQGISDSPEARQALQTIFDAALEDMSPEQMPPDVVDAYNVLWNEAELSLEGPAGAPGNEGQKFDPELLYEDALDDISFSRFRLDGLLNLLGLTSFWKMKQRARRIGEGGAADLLRQLQERTGNDVRIHLLGHSFGCIVISAAVAGAGGNAPLPRPVHSVFLAQGALSCWAFTPKIPIAKDQPGYFAALHDGRIAGALVTTQSRHDAAVGKAYPLATSRRSVSFAPGASSKKPRGDGGLGAFGIQGPGVDLSDLSMLPVDETYDFEAGRTYNLEGSAFIRNHGDLATPEMAHAFWSAVRV